MQTVNSVISNCKIKWFLQLQMLQNYYFVKVVIAHGSCYTGKLWINSLFAKFIFQKKNEINCFPPISAGFLL